MISVRIRAVLVLILTVVSVSAQGPQPKNTNPKPDGFKKATPPRSGHLEDAANLLMDSLINQVPFGLATDAIADRWAIIAKLWSKLDDGTIGVAKRPPALKTERRASTYPNRIDEGPPKLGVYDGNDPGNTIVLWEDQWNADGTYHVPNAQPQSKALSEAWLAALLIHELVHADQHVFRPSLPNATEHLEIASAQGTVLLEASAWKGLTGADAELAEWHAKNISPRPGDTSLVTQRAKSLKMTTERPPNNPNH